MVVALKSLKCTMGNIVYPVTLDLPISLFLAKHFDTPSRIVNMFCQVHSEVCRYSHRLLGTVVVVFSG